MAAPATPPQPPEGTMPSGPALPPREEPTAAPVSRVRCRPGVRIRSLPSHHTA